MSPFKKIAVISLTFASSFSNADNVIRINVPIRVADEKPPAPSPVRESYVGRTFSYSPDKTNWYSPSFSFDYDADSETLTVKTMPGLSVVTLSDGRVITPPNRTIHLSKTDKASVVSVHFNFRPDLSDTVYCFRPVGSETYADVQGTCNKISSLNFKL